MCVGASVIGVGWVVHGVVVVVDNVVDMVVVLVEVGNGDGLSSVYKA